MSAYFATRYTSARDEVVAILSDPTEGFGAEYFGNVDAPTGYVQIVRLTEDCDLDFSDHTNYPLGDEAGDLARTYGVTSDEVRGLHAVVSSDQGFVTVLTFVSEEVLASWVRETEAAYAEWEDQD